MGVVLMGEMQIVLVDMFGIFDVSCCFDWVMVQVVWGGVVDVDLIVLVVDVKGGLGLKVEMILNGLVLCFELKLLVFNKVDVVDKEKLLCYVMMLGECLYFIDMMMISVLIGDGVDDLKVKLVLVMFEGLWMFFVDQVSDVIDCVMVVEIICEQIFLQFYQELFQVCVVEIE